MKTIREYLNESSLSRIYKQTQEHDYGTITAFRSARDCNTGSVYTKKENLQRNKSLVSKLRAKGYGVTSIKGSYIENYGTKNAKEVGENSFLVIDLKDNGKLRTDLLKLGEEFEQDSIIFGKAGTGGTLVGASKCPDGYPAYHKEKKQGGAVFGKKGEFLSRVNGRPFVFKESIEAFSYFIPVYPTELRSISLVSLLDWREIEIDEDEL